MGYERETSTRGTAAKLDREVWLVLDMRHEMTPAKPRYYESEEKYDTSNM